MNMKTLLAHNSIVKVTSLGFGFCIWLIISQNQIVSITKIVPLSFYNQPKNCTVYAPETIAISAFGPKQHLVQTFTSEYAIHLNLGQYQTGNYEIELSNHDLFLPQSVKLLQLKPTLLQIKIAQ